MTPDGQWIVTEINSNQKTGVDTWLSPTKGAEPPVKYLSTPFNERQARLAPGAQWIAYVSDESGRNEVYVDSFPRPGNHTLVSTNGGTLPIWRKDGAELYYIGLNGDLLAVPVTMGPTGFHNSPPQVLYAAPALPFRSDGQRSVYAVLGKGDRFIFAAITHAAQPRGISVLMNWITDVEK